MKAMNKFEKPCFPTNSEKEQGVEIRKCIPEDMCLPASRGANWSPCNFGKLHPDYAEYTKPVNPQPSYNCAIQQENELLRKDVRRLSGRIEALRKDLERAREKLQEIKELAG